MASIRLFVLGACLCTTLAYSFFLQCCFLFFNVFFHVFKMFLVGLATGRAVVFYEWHCVIDWWTVLYWSIQLYSCRLFDKLTYLLTYLRRLMTGQVRRATSTARRDMGRQHRALPLSQWYMRRRKRTAIFYLFRNSPLSTLYNAVKSRTEMTIVTIVRYQGNALTMQTGHSA